MSVTERTTHTPGPWTRHGNRIYAGDYADQGEPDLIVEVVSEDSETDARLIAAAPEMYQLLSELEEAGDVVEKLCVVCYQRPGNHLDWCDIGRVLRIARGEDS